MVEIDVGNMETLYAIFYSKIKIFFNNKTFQNNGY
jgi:hypothetical protein